MKSVKPYLAILGGFALSYIPNNYMSEEYENIAFYIVVAIVIIGIVWSISQKKKIDG
ncbi:hypothetical protein [Cellulophaga sp. L1A9]|uniref:hypothetical protein n=1 Tax=Cellulophaga sp. L1A9 TaxID=2686362 RepID=UPI00131CF477|nr:hypothetical protein [Cellulophaga sp. L1A9]